MNAKNTEESNQAPATKADLLEAMQMVAAAFEKVATKDDFNAMNEKMETFATKMETFATKKDMHTMKKELSDQFIAVAENLHKDLGDVNKDEISLIKDNQKLHNQRINTIEKRLHIS